jgi:Cys-tRNA(Pro)/Cys-tRNA(Cys) deacylase
MATATPATRVAQRAGIDHRVHAYRHDAGVEFGIEAVQRLGLDPARVYKTLVAKTSDDDYVVAVVPVAAQLDLKALAATVSAKHAEMARPVDAQRLTGYPIGGISPLGQKRRLPTVIDATASSFATIFVSAGKRGLELELAAADLVQLTNGTLAEVARW